MSTHGAEPGMSLGINLRNLIRAFALGGFISCSDSIELLTYSSGDHEVDFRDFCHAVAMYVLEYFRWLLM